MRSKSKSKPGTAAVSAASSPRKSVDLECPSPLRTPRAREKVRSLDLPVARHGGGRSGGGVGAVEYKLPVPVTDPAPEPLPVGSLYEEAADVAAAAGESCPSVPESSLCSDESSDEAPDQHGCR